MIGVITKWSLISIITICTLGPAYAFNSRSRKHGTIALQKSFYKDLKVVSGADFDVQDTWDIEFGYRFYRTFLVTLNTSVGDGSNSDRTDYGIGIRVGLPGFFFLGGRLADVTRRRMKNPVDTSIYFVNSISEWKTSSGSPLVKTSAYRFGFTSDIFLYDQSYMRIELGIYNTRGNAHMSTSVGFGYEF